MLRPDVSAKISNATHIAVANTAALEFIDEDIKNDETVYPPSELLDRLELDRPQSVDYERKRTRYWTQLRVGKNAQRQ